MSSTKSEESYNYVEEMDDKNDCDIEMKVDTVEHLKTEDTEEKYCAKVGKKEAKLNYHAIKRVMELTEKPISNKKVLD